MLRNRLYYGLKPLLPWSVRMGVRRWLAQRKRERVRDIWPILPGSERPPEEWPGWPEGKQFALVLTHDVEGPAGLDKCRQLMELERQLGFRSCFNLVPENGYAVPRELREELAANGFEVGVHDLCHDGKLFLRRKQFSRDALKINQYLKEWGATGFRAGFMLHNLEWIHDLNVQYDTSTFDTDPFEPQPQGQRTIFPFWVQRNGECGVQSAESTARSQLSTGNGSRGYVELPYTLPQDSTLFLTLGERHPDIWFQKLDWVAKHGGMALVNVHPDYVRFEQEANSAVTYPVELYARFLGYARQRHGGSFWQVNPAELARWYRGTLDIERPKPVALRTRSSGMPVAARPRRICMVAYSYYQTDNRVMRYSEELARRGDTVDVLAIKNDPSQADTDMVGQVKVSRIQCRQRKDESTRAAYLLPTLRFLIAASGRLAWRQIRRPYDLVHVHNMPDFLVFAAWLPKLLGAKVILDIHDILPELYASKFNSATGSVWTNTLKLVERMSARFADHVIISNDLWRDKYTARTGAGGRCSVFINNVDTAVFRPCVRTRDDGKLIILFPGGLQWHQGLDIGIRAFKRVAAELPNAEFHIYGDGIMKGQLKALAQELGLEPKVRFFKPLPVHQIAEIMANADLGVVPKRADSFGNEAYSTKIMEFMSVGVPVAVSSTKIDRFYFDDSVVRFFESGNDNALAAAMIELLRDEDLRRRMAARGLDYAARNSWDHRKSAYLNLVDSLIEGRPPVPPDNAPPAQADSDHEPGDTELNTPDTQLKTPRVEQPELVSKEQGPASGNVDR